MNELSSIKLYVTFHAQKLLFACVALFLEVVTRHKSSRVTSFPEKQEPTVVCVSFLPEN